MTRVPGTDLFHYTTRLEPTAAVSYGFIVDYGEPGPDPRNPREASGLFGDVSWFAMPGWNAPDYLDEAAPERQGRLEAVEWQSAVSGGKAHRVQVYLPAGYDAGDRRYPVAYVHSGDRALEQGRMKNALDRLIGSRVAPLIAVFVLPPAGEEKPSRRDDVDEHYAERIVGELVPLIDERYRTIAEARARASIGCGQIGGRAVVLAFEHPELFGRTAAQSPMLDASEIPGLAERGADERPLVIYLDWGTYHMRSPHEAWSLVDSMRELWAALRKAGYLPAGGERPEGFGWPIWAGHTGDLLAALFPLPR
jgi:enterochelin esterase-like enzyme